MPLGTPNGSIAHNACPVFPSKARELRSADLIGDNDVYVQMYELPCDTDGNEPLPEPDTSKIRPSGCDVSNFQLVSSHEALA